jgi:hemolysin III
VYLLMGWMSLFIIVPLARAVGLRTLLWLLIGGVFYSLGAVIYGLKKPNLIPRWLGFHEIFHLFIILGSLSHFYFVYLLAQ